jgi:hypothetical protein
MRSDSVQEPSALFDALYSGSHGSVNFPAIEPRLTIVPPCCARMCGTASCAIPSAAKKFSSHIRRVSSMGVLHDGR